MNNIIIKLLQDKIEEYSILAKDEYEKQQYYCWDENIKRNLITLLRIRSEYKRALKEYKELCDFVTKEKYKKFIEEHSKNPDKYIEEILGIKLSPYQKLILKLFNNKRNNTNYEKLFKL
jgi:5'-deoxynucleotidase YfbR-like HD superfamily hydrolase